MNDLKSLSLALYYRDIARTGPLSLAEEIKLSSRIKKGDTAAMKKLVLANTRFVVNVAREYRNQGISFPDLINIGNMGLITAATKFDGGRNIKFISYAVWWVRQTILQALADQSRITKLPINRVGKIHRVRKLRDQLISRLGRSPDLLEIAEAAKEKGRPISLRDIKVAIENECHTVYMDAIIEEDITVADTFSDDTYNPEESVENESTHKNLLSIINNTLSVRESSILKMSFGLDGEETPKTLGEIGDRLGLTRERIRQIKTAALKKLRKVPQIKIMKERIINDLSKM